MPQVLATLKGAPLSRERQQLQQDAAEHASQDMRLVNLCQNAKDPAEVLLLFEVDDLQHCMHLTAERHAQARQIDPGAPLPEVLFLDDA